MIPCDNCGEYFERTGRNVKLCDTCWSIRRTGKSPSKATETSKSNEEKNHE